MNSIPAADGFAALGLPSVLLETLAAVGYEAPTPIQAATIPPLLGGRDVLGQAQTGTGKTAAFALPILARLDLEPRRPPQALVLAPTRELAIQVAEAFQTYAARLRGFQVLPIYGGQSYGPQLAGLKRGAQVVVGTPGRVIDHLERGSLDLSVLRFLVLDEADEMLRMGFIDDVEKVLQATPATRQVALFSATMPAQIKRIAKRHLRDPQEVLIASKTTTATNIRQRYWAVSGLHKLDAMTRILEAEAFEAMLVFTRTKKATEELAEKLAARGFAAGAINGDIAQPQRERSIQQLRDGRLDILVATDVAARGLDVERISHVLNYDIPYDTESYVHRIGRTGRAGRKGEAILFVSPRERGMLRAIERATRQPIEAMQLPSVEAVNDRRVERFLERIGETLAIGDLGPFRTLVERFEAERNVPAIEIAAALARLVHGDSPLLLTPPPPRGKSARTPRESQAADRPAKPFSSRTATPYTEAALPADGQRPKRPRQSDRTEHERTAPNRTNPGHAEFDHSNAGRTKPRRPESNRTEPRMQTWRIEVGHDDGVTPSNIVGAIANEAGLESGHIGRINIQGDHSLVDLPEGMPKEIRQHLRKVWVCGKQLRLHLDGEPVPRSTPKRPDRDASGAASPRARPHVSRGKSKPRPRKPR